MGGLQLTAVDAGPFRLERSKLVPFAQGMVSIPTTVGIIQHPKHGLVLWDTGVNHYRRGDILFKKDDAATEMFLTVTGKFLVREIDVEHPPGRLMGELGFLTPNKRRSATVECIEDGQVMTITYDRLLEIYFQNPQFGYYFLVLTSQRLLENISRLEGIIAQEKAARQTLATDDIA
jgi:CRP-like cAMP-binding protein